ncbi:MAG: phosphatase PAP2 family protein [Gaiellaceae bacterium]
MLGSIDDRAVIWISTHRFAPLNGFFVALGTVEKLGAIWVVCAIALGVAQRRGLLPTVVLAVLTGLATFIADSVTFGLKDLVHRTRPFDAHPAIHPLYVVHSSSFPAGHAATAFAGAVLLSYVAVRLAPLFFGLAALIAFSRVYDGVHYPTDVLAGAAIGAMVGGAAIVGLRLLARRFPAVEPLEPSATPRPQAKTRRSRA